MTEAEKNDDVKKTEEKEEEVPIDYTTDFELAHQEAREAEELEEYEGEIIARYKEEKLNEQIEDFIDKPKYKNQFTDIIADVKNSLIVDFEDINNHVGSIYDRLLENPKVFLRYFQQVLYDLDKKYSWNCFKENKFFAVRIANFYNPKEVSKIRVGLNNQFITFRGMVQRQSEIRPYVEKFYMRCTKCKLSRYTSYPATDCSRCENMPRMIPISDKHIFTDSVVIMIQELNEDLKGALPKAVECVVLGDIVDIIKAGGKVTITGFVALREIRNKLNDFLKYAVVVHVNNVEPIASNDLKLTLEETQLTKEEEKEILEFKKLPQKERLDILTHSYAPSIYGHSDVKTTLLLSLVGSGKIEVEGVPIRDRIHVLLIGDPSISKTQLLKFGELISLGSFYASGSGTTATGLTAAAVKEPDGTFALQPGYLIFANGTTLWFDEVDKVRPEVLGHLHQSMEDGLVSLAKGGTIATLNANTTIVSAMNPKGSRYDEQLPVIENIDTKNIPDSFLTRFDFIYIMIDKIDDELDRKVSRHIDSIIVDRVIPTYGINIFSTVKLRKYIEYVKLKNIDPVFDKEALQKIEDYYVEKRKKSTADTIAITARMKQGMLRSARASARLLLDRTVDNFHADNVIGLMDRLFESILKDEDGNYNVQQILGKTAGKSKAARAIYEICKRLVKEEDYPINRLPRNKVVLILIEEYKFSPRRADDLIEMAISQGIVRTPTEGKLEYLHEF